MVFPVDVFRPKNVKQNQQRFAHEALLYQPQVIAYGLVDQQPTLVYPRITPVFPDETSPRNTKKHRENYP